MGHVGEAVEEGEVFAPDTGAGLIESRENRAARHRRHRVRAANYPAPGDTGSVTPPDTQGTVGPNHLIVTLNNNLTIESRTGTILKPFFLACFRTTLGNTNHPFTPPPL